MSPEDRRPSSSASHRRAGTGLDRRYLFARLLPDVEMQAIQGAHRRAPGRRAATTRTTSSRARKNTATLAFDFLRDLAASTTRRGPRGRLPPLLLQAPPRRDDPGQGADRRPAHRDRSTDLWKAADWHEREAATCSASSSTGHPNLVPILLPDDMLDHFPLRKDNPLAPLEEWQGEQPRRRDGPAPATSRRAPAST